MCHQFYPDYCLSLNTTFVYQSYYEFKGNSEAMEICDLSQ